MHVRRPSWLWAPHRPMLVLGVALGAVTLGVTSHPSQAECLATMTSKELWEPCMKGKSPCWTFIDERPFVAVRTAANDTDAARRRLFPCSEAWLHGIGGDHIALLPVLGDGTPTADGSAPERHMCVYAGDADECTFDELVQYIHDSGTDINHPAFGAALGSLDAMLNTPERADMGMPLEPIYRVGALKGAHLSVGVCGARKGGGVWRESVVETAPAPRMMN